MAIRQTEGSRCRCASEIEHTRLLMKIDDSFKQDYDRNSERRRSAPTTETMRAKVKALTNGHSRAIKV